MEKLFWRLAGIIGIIAMIGVEYSIYIVSSLYTPKAFYFFLAEAAAAFACCLTMIFFSIKRLREIKREESLFPKGKLDVSETP